VTVSGNTFGGSATRVTITENGRGSVTPSRVSSSPFAFTYSPASEDRGKTIVITIATNDPPGRRCTAIKATYSLTINSSPAAPVIGSVDQPDCSDRTGSVSLTGLPDDVTWTLNSIPGGSKASGKGNTVTISGLDAGKYNFMVTTSAGCSSPLSGTVDILAAPATPTVKVTDPSPVCFPSTVDLTSQAVTAGSTEGLAYTYWRNNNGTRLYSTPAATTDGTYYIKGAAANGCYDIKPVRVTVKNPPEADAGSDKVLDYEFKSVLEASPPGQGETGRWTVISGSGVLSDISNARTNVDNLSLGKNSFLWTLTNGVCDPSSDTANITVKDLVIPTLITPNMDGKNDYLVIRPKETIGKIELFIFDRRGVEVFRNSDYDNLWNGINYQGNPLPDDTYFYILQTANGKSASGFIVIRR
jgi:gliding motility-associated-like protein